ncbi:transcription factor HES-5-like [Ascaphus truei]|uniref:transcription factor HES-5-like n=1 Tax=Ascaphus truei TaxID=8439 RepID=UPI003F5994E0
MAPSFDMFTDATKDQQNGPKKNKIRKPVVEKMRRDRINSSIEQLRMLLEKDIQTHHPHSKLEKADILEMAVSFMQQQMQHQMNNSQCHQKIEKDSYYQGYYRCPKEMVGFTHTQEPEQHGHPQVTMLNRFSRDKTWTEHCLPSYQTALVSHRRVSCQDYQCNRKIWRPW